ncbi:uncharacterized protein B0J16DRAFT_408931 [Fusarium flagelliforme]|nr:uncharacterized protein B0J16DRAFT_408931 [Fusarium flagelliforme]KAH7197293.1 hypothetical protein B0J16DRAFT_408931 [Fusarium flagelliforme]
MIITHPKIEGAPAPKVGLPYTTLRNEETIAQYVERVDEHELVEVTIKMAISQKTIKAQSFALNAVGDILRIGSQSSQNSAPPSQSRQVPLHSMCLIDDIYTIGLPFYEAWDCNAPGNKTTLWGPSWLFPETLEILALGVNESSGPRFVANKNRLCVGTTRHVGALFVVGDVNTVPEVMTVVNKKKPSLQKSDDMESESVKADIFWMMFRQAKACGKPGVV